jgi:hypothetical protein
LRHGYPIAVLPVELRAQRINALGRVQSGGSRDELDDLVRSAVARSLR